MQDKSEHARKIVPIIQFLGATGTVTGSRFVVTHGRSSVLIDCGLFQGSREERARNRDPVPFDVNEIDAVILTHAHVDHCGFVPALVAAGYSGPVYASPGTVALAAIVLPDSGHLQEEEARFALERGYSKHRQPTPIYTEQDARRSLQLFRELPFGAPFEVAHGIVATLRPAGHILGSASVTLRLGGTHTLVFSGDLGRSQHPLLSPPPPIGDADTVVIESTYGNREHASEHALELLADGIRRTAKRGGTMVIPSFAVDRTEVLLYHLRILMAQGAIPQLPVYVDSPMALAALDVYRDALRDRSGEFRPEVLERAEQLDLFDTGTLHEIRDVEESKRLNTNRVPSIIISASGMATGGRVLHHLANRLTDPRNTVVLVGFQAAGTRGRRLADGEHQIKLLGQYVPVRGEVLNLPMFSVHADASELIDWLRSCSSEPTMTFIVHGEPDAAEALRNTIESTLGWMAVTPHYLERVALP